MSGFADYTDSKVINLHAVFADALPRLRSKYPQYDIELVIKNGRYYLEVDGQLIAIEFLNGQVIDPITSMNFTDALVALLTSHGFSPLNTDQESKFDETDLVAQHARALFSMFGLHMLTREEGESSAITAPTVERITVNNATDVITIEYDQTLNASRLPTSDDFEILVNGAQVSPQSITIRSEKVELQLNTDVQPGDQVVVKYIDQNGDLDNSIQNDDGLLASAFFQGIVIDGYISGAQIYLDQNGDGIPNQSELVAGVTTNDQGIFLLDESLNPDNVPILIVGGINLDTGLPNNTVLAAPPGATVITPTTTLIQTMVRENIVATQEEAAEIIKTELGLETTLDLLKFDPIVAEKNPDTNSIALEVHKFNTSVIAIMDDMGNGSDEQAKTVMFELAKTLATNGQTGQFVFDEKLIKNLKSAVGHTDAESNSNALVATLEEIEAATDTNEVALTQQGIGVLTNSLQLIDFVLAYQEAATQFQEFTKILDVFFKAFDASQLTNIDFEDINYLEQGIEIPVNQDLSLLLEFIDFDLTDFVDESTDVLSSVKSLTFKNGNSIDLKLELSGENVSIIAGDMILSVNGYPTNNLIEFVTEGLSDLDISQIPESASIELYKGTEKLVKFSGTFNESFTIEVPNRVITLTGEWSNWSAADRQTFFDYLQTFDPFTQALNTERLSGFALDSVSTQSPEAHVGTGVAYADLYSIDTEGALTALNVKTSRYGKYELSAELVESLKQANQAIVAKDGYFLSSGDKQDVDYVALPGNPINFASTYVYHEGETYDFAQSYDEFVATQAEWIVGTLLLDIEKINYAGYLNGDQVEYFDLIDRFYSLYENYWLAMYRNLAETETGLIFGDLFDVLSNMSDEEYQKLTLEPGTKYFIELQQLKDTFLQSNTLIQMGITEQDIEAAQVLSQSLYSGGISEQEIYFLGFDSDNDGAYLNHIEAVSSNLPTGGLHGSGDNTVSIWLDVSDFTEGEQLDLYVNGEKVDTSAPLNTNDVTQNRYKFVSSDGSDTFAFENANELVSFESKLEESVIAKIYDNYAKVQIKTGTIESPEYFYVW